MTRMTKGSARPEGGATRFATRQSSTMPELLGTLPQRPPWGAGRALPGLRPGDTTERCSR